MLLESLRLAVEALGRNALRSSLTALGIFIGVAAVITMVTIGRGATAKVGEEIGRLGSDLLTLGPGQQRRAGSGASTASGAFDYSDIEALQSEISGLRQAAPLASQPMLAVARNKNWTANVAGTENGYFLARGWRMAQGRMFTEQETYNGRPVCIIGETVRRRLFGERNGLNEALRIGTVPCIVIGILAARGQSGAAEDDDNLIAVPFDTYQRRIQGSPDIEKIVMAVYPGADLMRVKSAIMGLMRERRSIGARDEDDFELLDMRQVAQSMEATTRTLTLFLGAIAAVSLLVGGIGIMNIMLVSVAERTREIGVRLAIGALPSQVRLQFLVEAVLLTTMGGLIGVAAGIGAAAFAAPVLGIPLVIDPFVVVISVSVSVGLGVGFGYAPAASAASLDPIEALRHE